MFECKKRALSVGPQLVSPLPLQEGTLSVFQISMCSITGTFSLCASLSYIHTNAVDYILGTIAFLATRVQHSGVFAQDVLLCCSWLQTAIDESCYGTSIAALMFLDALLNPETSISIQKNHSGVEQCFIWTPVCWKMNRLLTRP